METFGVDFLRHDIQALEDYHKSLTDEQLLGPTLRCRFRVAVPKLGQPDEIREYDPVDLHDRLYNDPDIDLPFALKIVSELEEHTKLLGAEYVREQVLGATKLFAKAFQIPALSPERQDGLTFEELYKIFIAFLFFLERFKKKLLLLPRLPRDSVTRQLQKKQTTTDLTGCDSSTNSTEQESTLSNPSP